MIIRKLFMLFVPLLVLVQAQYNYQDGSKIERKVPFQGPLPRDRWFKPYYNIARINENIKESNQNSKLSVVYPEPSESPESTSEVNSSEVSKTNFIHWNEAGVKIAPYQSYQPFDNSFNSQRAVSQPTTTITPQNVPERVIVPYQSSEEALNAQRPVWTPTTTVIPQNAPYRENVSYKSPYQSSEENLNAQRPAWQPTTTIIPQNIPERENVPYKSLYQSSEESLNAQRPIWQPTTTITPQNVPEEEIVPYKSSYQSSEEGLNAQRPDWQPIITTITPQNVPEREIVPYKSSYQSSEEGLNAQRLVWQPTTTITTQNVPERVIVPYKSSEESLNAQRPIWQPTITSTAQNVVEREYVPYDPRYQPAETTINAQRPIWKSTITTPTVNVERSTRKPVIQYTTTTEYYENQLINYNCRRANGYEAVPNNCDIFVECNNNNAYQSKCSEGQYFDVKIRYPGYPCVDASQVQCQRQSVEQPNPKRVVSEPTKETRPEPIHECPKPFGYFNLPVGDCGKYIQCLNSGATVMSCPPGLAFNLETISCDWPVNVPGCNPEAFKDFTCPSPILDEDGEPTDLISNHSYKNSCKNYIACLKGHPRLLSCSEEQSFDVRTNQCVSSELVNNCDG